MKGYVVCMWEKINSEEKLKEYAIKATFAAEKYSGKFLIRGGQQTEFEEKGFERTVVAEFNSYDDAIECYNSSEYQSALIHVKGSALRLFTVVEGI